MLASAIVITVFVVGGVLVWRAFGGGDSNSLAAANSTWNQIALVNRTRGTVTTVDANGAAIAEFAGFGRIQAVHTEGSRVVLVGPNDIYVGSFEPEALSPSTSTTTSTTPGATGNTEVLPGGADDRIGVKPAGSGSMPASSVLGTASTATAALTPSTGSASTSTVESSTNRAEASPPAGFTTVAYPRGSTVTRLPIANRLVLAVGQPLGGNALLIDGQSGLVVDIGALAAQADPLLFLDTIQFDPKGNLFAIADAANFQTIVVTTLPEPAVEFFPDAPLAVSEALVVTSQVVGQRADVAFFEHDGTTVRSISMSIPAGGVLTDSGLIVVSVDGDISRVAGDLSTPTRLGSIDQPDDSFVARVDPAGSGARLVVSGDSFQTVIDLDGNTIAAATFDIGATVVEPQPGWTCLPLGPHDSIESLVALDDGSVRADVTGFKLVGVSADGCTLLGEADPATSGGTATEASSTATRAATDMVMVDAEGTVSLGPSRAGVLSPDGTTVVRTTRTSAVELVRRDDESFSQPVDLTNLTQPAALAVAFLSQ